MTSTTRIVATSGLEQVNNGERTPPDDWRSRRLYVGMQGAANWLAIVRQKAYPLHGKNAYNLGDSRMTAVENLKVGTFVSLGPGDGIVDVSLINCLKTNSRHISYIPVDISDSLLRRAIAEVANHAPVPIGLLCDYEEWPTVARQSLKESAIPPALFSLVGGGFGNLDKGERHFMEIMKSMMSAGDHLLLDIPLAGRNWRVEDDPRFRKDEYSEEFESFLATGLRDCNAPEFRRGGARNFAQLVWCDIRNSDIPGTRSIVIHEQASGCELLRFCRYEWDEVTSWMAQECGFRIAYQQHAFGDDGKFGMGVLLLARGE